MTYCFCNQIFMTNILVDYSFIKSFILLELKNCHTNLRHIHLRWTKTVRQVLAVWITVNLCCFIQKNVYFFQMICFNRLNFIAIAFLKRKKKRDTSLYSFSPIVEPFIQFNSKILYIWKLNMMFVNEYAHQ